jgi:hypothetical protein
MQIIEKAAPWALAVFMAVVAYFASLVLARSCF